MLAAGGTISMRGEHAVPALDAAQLVEAVPELENFRDLTAESVLGLPGSQISLTQALDLAQRAAAAAAGGAGVVITSGTDTLEELAVLCALHHAGDAPIVLTGANRPASAPGADGPANLLDAVTLAATPGAAGVGVAVVFGGEVHAAMSVRKVDSTGPAAFGSPVAGPLGRIVDGRLWLHARARRPPHITPPALGQRVPIITAALGEDGELLTALGDTADGLVVVAFGAGHLTPGMNQALQVTAPRIPVVVTVRPERGSMLHATYGFEGAERDLRRCGAICAPFLSAAAARIVLLCCLGAGLDRDAIAAALAAYDA
jgi:L-asparaginase